MGQSSLRDCTFFLRISDELILTEGPLTALALIRNNQATATFHLGSAQRGRRIP
jgi:hypothetical protein